MRATTIKQAKGHSFGYATTALTPLLVPGHAHLLPRVKHVEANLAIAHLVAESLAGHGAVPVVTIKRRVPVFEHAMHPGFDFMVS